MNFRCSIPPADTNIIPTCYQDGSVENLDFESTYSYDFYVLHKRVRGFETESARKRSYDE